MKPKSEKKLIDMLNEAKAKLNKNSAVKRKTGPLLSESNYKKKKKIIDCYDTINHKNVSSFHSFNFFYKSSYFCVYIHECLIFFSILI